MATYYPIKHVAKLMGLHPKTLRDKCGRMQRVAKDQAGRPKTAEPNVEAPLGEWVAEKRWVWGHCWWFRRDDDKTREVRLVKNPETASDGG